MSHELIARLREMKLYGMASQWPELSAKARRQALAPEQWFGELLQAEATERQVRALANQRKAARCPAQRDLSGCELYGSSRACPMCEAAAYWARIARLRYGEGPADGGVPALR